MTGVQTCALPISCPIFDFGVFSFFFFSFSLNDMVQVLTKLALLSSNVLRWYLTQIMNAYAGKRLRMKEVTLKRVYCIIVIRMSCTPNLVEFSIF